MDTHRLLPRRDSDGANSRAIAEQVPLSAPQEKEALRASIFLVCNKKERDLNGQEAAT